MDELGMDLSELHWGLQVMDSIDVGLVVLDREYKVCLWNSFMQSYSGIRADQIMQHNLFDVVTDLPSEWLKAKIDASTQLQTRGFSNWEDRPHIFQFNNYAPLSNGVEPMYQNLVITPLKSLNGEVSHVCLMIQDVSYIARNKLQLKATNQQLSVLSRTDGLTGLFNRAYWESRLNSEFNQLSLAEGKAALVIFDIDHFKKINDTYGHGAGDEVIRNVAEVVRRSARASDLCGRYGGEEFTVLLPNTTADQALYFAERLRKRIENLSVKTEAGEVRFTISLGVSEYNSRFNSHQSWLEHADNALYQSKKSGRNKTSLAR